MQQAADAFSGVAFHAYAGNVAQQDTFHNAYSSKEIYFTEATGLIGTDWWTDLKVSLIGILTLQTLTIIAVVHG